MNGHKDSVVHKHAYTDTMHNTIVAVIGPLPPPLGGVSVHVERTLQKLIGQNNIVLHYNSENMYPYAWMRRAGIKYGAYLWYMVRLCIWLVYNRPRVIIYHLFYARAVLPELGMLKLLKRVMGSRMVLVEHDCRHMYERTVTWQRWYAWLLAGLDQLVLIGSVTARSYSMLVLPEYTVVESAFLPPDVTQQQRKMAEYPDQLVFFLHDHSPCVLVSAFACVVWQEKDLYGLDQAIIACAQLRAAHVQMGLVILLSTIGDEQYYQRLCALIEQYDLREAVYMLHGNYTLWPLFEHVDIFIRPTLSDGASVSVQEALFCGLATIASDVCWRPSGTVLYKTADSVDLSVQMKQLLKNKGSMRDHKQRHYMYTQ